MHEKNKIQKRIPKKDSFSRKIEKNDLIKVKK